MTTSTARICDKHLEPLTVQGLIDVLARFSPDTRVVVDGYEGGFDTLHAGSPRMISIRRKPDHAEWEGEYEEAERNPSESVISAVRLPRKSF